MEDERIPLSERELEIMRLVATGATNRQIARDLNISINTVKVHLRNVFEKLSVQSRTEATMYLVRAGLVTVDGGPSLSEIAAEPALTEAATLGDSGRIWNPRIALAVAAVLVLVVGAVLWNRTRAYQPAPATQPTASPPPPRWQPGPSLPAPRFGLGVVAYQGRIYALAGYTSTTSTESTEASPLSHGDGVTGLSMVMNPETGAWTDLPDKPTAVGDVQAAVLEGRIFVPGGRLADGTITTTVEAFDPTTATWERVADLPGPRSRYALVALEGKLILYGGWDGNAVQSSVLEFDADAGQWSALTSLPSPRADMASAVIEDAVYLIGGTNGQQPLPVASVYHVYAEGTAAGPWKDLETLPEPRAGAAAATIARSIYLVGGGEGLPPIRYDLTARTWGEVDPFSPSPWYDMGVTTVGNKLYVIGGRNEQPLDSSWEYTALYLYFLPQGAFSR